MSTKSEDEQWFAMICKQMCSLYSSTIFSLFEQLVSQSFRCAPTFSTPQRSAWISTCRRQKEHFPQSLTLLGVKKIHFLAIKGQTKTQVLPVFFFKLFEGFAPTHYLQLRWVCRFLWQSHQKISKVIIPKLWPMHWMNTSVTRSSVSSFHHDTPCHLCHLVQWVTLW